LNEISLKLKETSLLPLYYTCFQDCWDLISSQLALLFCSPVKYSFGEHGLYTYKIHAVKDNAECVTVTDEQPDNAYFREYYM